MVRNGLTNNIQGGGLDLKPYEFVPVNNKVVKEPLRPRNEIKKELHYGKWQLRLKVMRPLIVASGKLTLHEEKLIKGHVKSNGDIVVPGSSIKGVIRSIYESISYSCFERPVIKSLKYRVAEYTPQTNSNGCEGPSICPSCQVFGYVNRRNVGKSLVYFNDFHLIGDKSEMIEERKIPQLFQPLRQESALDHYLDDDSKLQRKFYTHGKPQTHEGQVYEVIKEGAEFVGEISYEHLTDEEMGRLAFAFGLGHKPFPIKVGYGKPAYLGSVQVELLKVTAYRSFAFQSKPLDKDQVMQLSEKSDAEDELMQKHRQRILEIFDFEKNKDREWAQNQFGKKGY